MAAMDPDVLEMPADSGVGLMPYFTHIGRWARTEIDGLSDEQLDFDDQAPSNEWMWWSIRRQVSHIAWVSLIFSKRRCGALLWPDGDIPEPIKWSEHHQGRNHKHGLRLDPALFWEIPDLLDKLDLGLSWIRRVVAENSIETFRAMSESRHSTHFWDDAITVLPRGAWHDPDDDRVIVNNLECAIWMLFYEMSSHIRTIHRLKEIQGLPTVVDLARFGYLRLPHYWGETDTPAPSVDKL
ncbi:hypothetical protein [Candidatus Poriferisodalis sp.]|uniref:hypothetical protein n=1 Tax=Candidatus Poriferisodalis sp. TaxID=3101277 RepID=UPI003B02066D